MKPVPFKRRRRSWRGVSPHNLGTAVFVVALAACAGYANLPGGAGGSPSGGADTFTGQVTRVVDGDTFWISSADERIRVWGLDAPEIDQPGGARATAALAGLISRQQLTCRQRDIDRYGRIVGQCFLPDGRDVTAAMIASGTAEEYCRYSGNHYRTC
jgi:endonuclease YncB( thermonuclease family)